MFAGFVPANFSPMQANCFPNRANTRSRTSFWITCAIPNAVGEERAERPPARAGWLKNQVWRLIHLKNNGFALKWDPSPEVGPAAFMGSRPEGISLPHSWPKRVQRTASRAWRPHARGLPMRRKVHCFPCIFRNARAVLTRKVKYCKSGSVLPRCIAWDLLGCCGVAGARSGVRLVRSDRVWCVFAFNAPKSRENVVRSS